MGRNFLITGAAAGIGLEYTRQGSILSRARVRSEMMS